MHEEIGIGGVPVGPSHSPFVIAEIGINHNGSVALAKSLIEMAHRCGCHAVKFQKRTVPVIYTPEELAKSRPVPRFIIEDALKRGVLPEESVKRLKDSNLEDTTNGDLKWLLEFTEDEYGEISFCGHLESVREFFRRSRATEKSRLASNSKCRMVLKQNSLFY